METCQEHLLWYSWRRGGGRAALLVSARSRYLSPLPVCVCMCSDMASHLLESTGDVLGTRMDECCRILHKHGDQPERRRLVWSITTPSSTFLVVGWLLLNLVGASRNCLLRSGREPLKHSALPRCCGRCVLCVLGCKVHYIYTGLGDSC